VEAGADAPSPCVLRVVALMYGEPWLGSSWVCVWTEGVHVRLGGVWGSPITLRMLPLGYQVGMVGVVAGQGGGSILRGGGGIPRS